MTALKGAALSRRGFLVGSGGVLAAITLAACTPAGSSSASTLSLLLPGTAPTGWDRVLEAANKKLRADLGFEFRPEFIAWSEYPTQSLLKFTAGEKFETALSARWLNMAQLVSSGALVPLSDELASGKYKNLSATVSQEALDANTWDGEVYGIPAVNSAARLHHYVARQDLVEKHAGGSIDDYDQLEKFWYDVKQKEGILGYAAPLNRYSVLGAPTGVFYRHGWSDPSFVPIEFTGDSLKFVPSARAASTGVADLVPFWEFAPYVEALHDARRYYEDGIINADMLNVDSAAVRAQFSSGAAASTWGITDGLDTTTYLGELLKAIPSAALMSVAPFEGGLTALKPNQTFQADNNVVLNAAGADHGRALQLLDWLSIKENHDLVEYGVEGTDWTAIGDDRYEALGDYNNFPGYALSWRVDLERKSSLMSESEDELFEWSKDYANFTLDTFASFLPDLGPVENEHAQVTAAIAQFGLPLYTGAVPVDQGLDDLKKACETAGLAKLQDEINKQADAYLASR